MKMLSSWRTATLSTRLEMIFVLITGIGLSVLMLSMVTAFTEDIERIRVGFFWRWSEILFVLASIKFYTEQKRTAQPQGIVWVLIAMVAWLLITAIIGSNPEQSIWGNYLRRDGLVTFLHLLAFCFACAQCLTTGSINILSKVIAIITLVVSLVVIITKVLLMTGGWWQLESIVTFIKLLGTPNQNMLGGVLAVSFSFAWYTSRGKMAGLLALVVVAVLLTFSVGALASLGLAGVLISLKVLPSKLFQPKVVVLLGVTSVVVLIILVSKLVDWSNLTEGRELIFSSLSLAVRERPIFGWGWANVETAFDWVHTQQYGQVSGMVLDKAHAHWLEYLVVAGVPGLLLYSWLQVLSVRSLFHSVWSRKRVTWQFTWLVVLVVFIFHSQTNVLSITEEVFFWLVLSQTWWKQEYTPSTS